MRRSPGSRHRRHRPHAGRQAQGRPGGVAPDRPAGPGHRWRWSSAPASIPSGWTTWSAAAPPRSASRAATSSATRGSPPACPSRSQRRRSTGSAAVAGRPLRRPGRDRRALRHRHRLRGGVDDLEPDGVERQRRPRPVPARLHGRPRRPAQDPVRGGPDPRREVRRSPGSRWTPAPPSRTAGRRPPPTPAASPARSFPGRR